MLNAPSVSEVPGQLRRERLLDIESRLARSRRVAFVLLAVALLISGPWEGWWWLVPLAGAAVAFAVTERRMVKSDRPALWAGAGWAVSPLMIAVSVALTGGPDSSAVCWFALPAVTLAARFEGRAAILALLYIVALALVSTVPVDPGLVAEDPTLLIFPISLVAAAVILSWAVVESDREHRREAVIDPLTGLLNRSALARRLDELEQGRRSTDQRPLAMLLGDIDNFKQVNDEHGHAIGDAILRDAAYAMRHALRALDLVYRMGGEEFLVILPDAGLDEAMEVAQRIRQAVEACSRPGITVTMSIGAAAASGDDADPGRLFSQADMALYAAKNAGRNRVEPAPA